jgi:hypothetical protein
MAEKRRFVRIDKREARRIYDNGGVLAMSLEKPECDIGQTVEWGHGVTTVTKSNSMTFDQLAADGLSWKHRYPGSQGLVWYTPAPPARTPYDTGKRSEPKVWTERHIEDEGDYGKVDFEDDAGGTVATLYIEKDDDGIYVLRGYANERLKVEIEQNEEVE